MKPVILVAAVFLGWSTFAGNNTRSFMTEDPVWPPFSYKWSVNLGPPGTRVASPVTAENIRIVKFIRRDGMHTLFVKAFDKTGKQLWSFEKDLGIKIIFSMKSKDFEGSPTIADRCVFFTTTRTLAAISLDSGKLLWEHEYNLTQDMDISFVCPLVYGKANKSIVLVTVGKDVYMHDGNNGNVFSISENLSDPIPPVLLSGDSTLSPVHLDSNGKKLAQLPLEALDQKGCYASTGDLFVAYYLNACWKAWRYDRRYNRWEKAWKVEDETDQPSPFWSYRHATVASDRMLLTMPRKIVCVDFYGATIWEKEFPQCQWNQSIPVGGNVALLAAFVKSRVLQPIDVRDGQLYPEMELPLYPMTSPVPTPQGFMIVSTGASLWEFSSAAPPKTKISVNPSIKISEKWTDFDFPVVVSNTGGSRMAFSVSSDQAKIDNDIKKCDPGSTFILRASIMKMVQEQRISFAVDGDGDKAWATTYISASEMMPDRRDINLDGNINCLDALEVIRMMGEKPVGKPWDVRKRCDVNCDGSIGYNDLAIVGYGK